MRIGSYELKNRILLAPMAGITDQPFRRLCAHYGAGLTFSEMMSTNPQVWHTEKSKLRLAHSEELGLNAVQIAGSDPLEMAQAAAINVPVTLKIRTGWDKANRNCVQIGKIAEQSGIQALTIHGRTKECLFEGEAEYDNIRAVKQSISIPVIANGDVDSASKAKKVLEYTGADAIMIGRATLGNPWLFQAVESLVEHDSIIQTPSLREKCGHILRHIQELHQFYGEQKGYRIARKHVAWYLQGIQPDSVFRQTFNAINEPKEQLIVLEDFLNSILDKEKC